MINENLEFVSLTDKNMFLIRDDKSAYIYDVEGGRIAKIPYGETSEIAIRVNRLTEKITNTAKNNDHIMPLDFFKRDRASRLMLYLTSTCNLRCIYCHCNSDIGESMSIEMAKLAIHKYIESRRKQQLDIDVFQVTFMGGGEPMLEFRKIQEIVGYIESISLEEKFKPEYVLVTNGTVGTNNDWEWLIDNKFKITISCDGPAEIHDFQRKNNLTDSRTHHIIEKRFDFLSKKNEKIHVRSTIMDYRNVDIVCEYLNSIECIDSISVEPISYAGRGVELAGSHESLNLFYSNFFKEYSKYLYSNPKKYKSAWFKPFKRMDGFCGAVYHNSVVTSKGNITLCTEVDEKSEDNLQEEFFMGNVQDKNNSFISEKSINFSTAHSINNLDECKNCIVRYKCGGGCYIKKKRDFYNNIGDFQEMFCENVKKLNLSYLINVFENERQRNK